MVGQVAGIEQEPSGAQGTDGPGVKPLDFEALVDSEEPLALIGIFNSARMASASATGSLTGRRRVYPIGTITDISPGIAEIRPAFVGIRSLVEDDEQDSERIHPGLRIQQLAATALAHGDSDCARYRHN